MSIYRSYFSKNNTLIEDNLTNNSQNPVTEISYGTEQALVSRFIFDIDLQGLIDKITGDTIQQTGITSHVLHMTNTLAYTPDLISDRYADNLTERASSFSLEFFTITEDWDEGSGYDFVYSDEEYPDLPQQASNWTDRKTNTPWTQEGALITGGTGASTILGTQVFNKGNEDIQLDITDYINSLITGGTGVTSTNFGVGVRFVDDTELLPTQNRRAVAFHTKHTHTFYEPYVETTYSDRIVDDRNYFYMDKDNDLYLYSTVGGEFVDATVNSVTIYDYEGNQHSVISGSSIQKVRKGVYKVTVNIDSVSYPDAVLFEDVWDVTQSGIRQDVSQEFYLISPEQYYNFDLSNEIDPNNYAFNFYGIRYGEKIRRGGDRRVQLKVKELYPNQSATIPVDVEYRLYLSQKDGTQHTVIPFTPVDRTVKGYEFTLDTSWLIPQDYILELRMKSGTLYETKEPLKFTVISDEVYGAI